ncbi:MAG: putative quinol monooxygenase [Pyrinomonadaceae bacterium]
MSTIRVVAHLSSKPETIAETRAALEEFIDPTRAEAGCVYYELMLNNDDPTDFTFVEEWESNETLDAHLESPHILAFKERAGELLACDPDIRRYTLLK